MAGRPNRPIRPRGGTNARGKRRVVIDQGAGRPGGPQQRGRGGRQEVGPPKVQREIVPPTGPVTVQSGVTVRDFSQALGVQMPELIKILMNLGQMRTATQSLSDDEVELIAAELKDEAPPAVADPVDAVAEVLVPDESEVLVPEQEKQEDTAPAA